MKQKKNKKSKTLIIYEVNYYLKQLLIIISYLLFTRHIIAISVFKYILNINNYNTIATSIFKCLVHAICVYA